MSMKTIKFKRAVCVPGKGIFNVGQTYECSWEYAEYMRSKDYAEIIDDGKDVEVVKEEKPKSRSKKRS